MAQSRWFEGSAVTVNEFREILEDASYHNQLLKPVDMEAFAFYLLASLRNIGALNELTAWDDYVRTISDFLNEWFPKHTRIPMA